jgi:hypothetical protein
VEGMGLGATAVLSKEISYQVMGETIKLILREIGAKHGLMYNRHRIKVNISKG